LKSAIGIFSFFLYTLKIYELKLQVLLNVVSPVFSPFNCNTLGTRLCLHRDTSTDDFTTTVNFILYLRKRDAPLRKFCSLQIPPESFTITRTKSVESCSTWTQGQQQRWPTWKVGDISLCEELTQRMTKGDTAIERRAISAPEAMSGKSKLQSVSASPERCHNRPINLFSRT